jgi:RNA polymerase sigma factor (sigma-70 family)
MPWIEPGLERAVAELTESQRVAVVLVHGFGWTAREVAELLGVKATTVQTHVERALARLRSAMEVDHDG